MYFSYLPTTCWFIDSQPTLPLAQRPPPCLALPAAGEAPGLPPSCQRTTFSGTSQNSFFPLPPTTFLLFGAAHRRAGGVDLGCLRDEVHVRRRWRVGGVVLRASGLKKGKKENKIMPGGLKSHMLPLQSGVFTGTVGHLWTSAAHCPQRDSRVSLLFPVVRILLGPHCSKDALQRCVLACVCVCGLIGLC